MKDQHVMEHNKKSVVLTIIGAAVMLLMTVTKVIPSSTIAGYSVFVGIVFFFITEAADKTEKTDPGLRFHTIPADLKKPGVIPWLLLPIVSGVVSLVVGNWIFGGAFVSHVLGRASSVGASFDKTVLLIGQMLILALGEEIAYRGFFFGKTLKLFPAWLCAVVSSAVFAAGHIAAGNLGLVIYDVAAVFLDSLLFSVVCYKSGNCVISTISHILGNTVSLITMFLFF